MKTHKGQRENVMLNVNAKNLGAVAIISFQGEIVNGETRILRKAVDAMCPSRALILDLSRVTKIDAHGLGVMLELRKQSQSRGLRFEFMNVSKPVNKVLELSHLDSVFQISALHEAPVAA
jgi:anti-anti-sigma factor